MSHPQSILKVNKTRSTDPFISNKTVKWVDSTEGDKYPEDVESLENEIIVKRPRKKATMQEHVQHYNDIIALLDSEIDRKSRLKETGVRTFQKTRKMLLQMKKELPQVSRSKEAKALCSTRKKNINTGLNLEYSISEEMVEFLGVDSDTTLTRVDVMRAICVYIHRRPEEDREAVKKWFYLNQKGKRNLQDPNDRKYIIPDEKLSKLLNYKKFVQEVKKGKVYKKSKNEDGNIILVKLVDTRLSYMFIQKLIKDHFIAHVSSDTVDDTVDDDIS